MTPTTSLMSTGEMSKDCQELGGALCDTATKPDDRRSSVCDDVVIQTMKRDIEKTHEMMSGFGRQMEFLQAMMDKLVSLKAGGDDPQPRLHRDKKEIDANVTIFDDIAALYKKHGSTDQNGVDVKIDAENLNERLPIHRRYNAFREGRSDDSDFKLEGPYIDPSKNPLEYIKLISFYWPMFAKIKLPSNFTQYDKLIKFVIEVEDKFVLHGVNSKYKVEMFLKMIEGTDTMRDFFRFSKGLHHAAAEEIRAMTWKNFKREFIVHFLERGAWNKIYSEMSSWTIKTFKSPLDAINGYDMLIKILREINIVNEKGETNATVLADTNIIHFLHTIPGDVYEEVIQLMEIRDRGGECTKDIHDLSYEDLVNMLKKLHVNKEFQDSIYGRVKDQRVKAEERSDPSKASRSKEEVANDNKMTNACYNMLNGNVCTYGADCKYSHDPNVIALKIKKESEKNNNKK
jgi:hypothetical protein